MKGPLISGEKKEICQGYLNPKIYDVVTPRIISINDGQMRT
jgi:hypothetical protein